MEKSHTEASTQSRNTGSIRNVEIITDSVAQVPVDIAKQLNIHSVPSILILEGKKYKDGIDLDPKELYRRMKTDKIVVQTSSPTVGQFYEVFMSRLQSGVENLLYIGLSAGLSASFSAAESAAYLAREKYPDCKIELFDSKIATIAQGFVAMEAARIATNGASLEDVQACAEEARTRVGLVASMDTLEYLARGGRIGKVAYMLGSMIQIKPIVSIGEDGFVAPIGRVRSNREAIEKMVEYVGEKVSGRSNLHLAILEADARKRASILKEIALEKLRPNSLIWTDFTPVMVAHAGPGILGLAYYYN